jgi:hypothetical protein
MNQPLFERMSLLAVIVFPAVTFEPAVTFCPVTVPFAVIFPVAATSPLKLPVTALIVPALLRLLPHINTGMHRVEVWLAGYRKTIKAIIFTASSAQFICGQ